MLDPRGGTGGSAVASAGTATATASGFAGGAGRVTDATGRVFR